MKTLKILDEIRESNLITESQMKLIKNRMNKGEEIDISFIWDGEILVTRDQKQKGLEWLMKQYKTPKGKVKENNPFGYREIDVLENCSDIQLKGFFDAGNLYNKCYVPLYCVHSYLNSFDYYVNHKGIQIIG